MAKINIKERITDLCTKPVKTSFYVFLFATILVFLLTLFFYGYDNEFLKNVLVEAHGMLFDILVIGTFIFALQEIGRKKIEKEQIIQKEKIERERNIQRWQEEIEDFRYWESKEAAHRIAGNIKRLNKTSITDINLKRCYLVNANLGNANLQGVNFEGAKLQNAALFRANLQGAMLEGVNLQGADFREAKLQGVYLAGANLKKAILWKTNLQEAKFWVVNLQGAFLKGANLQGAMLKGVNLQGTNLVGANLQEVFFGSVCIPKTILYKINLWGANPIVQEDMFIIAESNLKKANLAGANLQEVYLAGVNLQKAILVGTNLQEADLWGANLQEANFIGANLKKTRNLKIEQLSKVKTLYRAKLDSELEKEIKEKYLHLLEKPDWIYY